MQFLSFFWKTPRIRMLKTFNRARIHSPIVFYEKINAILYQKIDPKNDKVQNFLIFKDFKQFLSNFQHTSLIKILRTLNMARICCAVGFSEKIIAFFPNEKGLKLIPKITKKHKTFHFSNF